MRVRYDPTDRAERETAKSAALAAIFLGVPLELTKGQVKVKHNDTKSDLWKDFNDVKTILMYGDKVTTKTKSKVIQMATGKLRARAPTNRHSG